MKCKVCGTEDEDRFHKANRSTCRGCSERRKREREKRRCLEDPEYRARYKETHKRYKKANRLRHPKNAATRKRKSIKRGLRHNKKKYGLTPEIEQRLLDKQKHKCPACGRKFSDKVK